MRAAQLRNGDLFLALAAEAEDKGAALEGTSGLAVHPPPLSSCSVPADRTAFLCPSGTIGCYEAKDFASGVYNIHGPSGQSLCP